MSSKNPLKLERELDESQDWCEEASPFAPPGLYVACGARAVAIVAYKGRTERGYRMCEGCVDHNVHNRGGYIVKRLDQGATS